MFTREELRASARTLAAPVAIALLLDALFYTGFFASDDNGYLSTAHRVVSGEPMPIYIGSVRAGMAVFVVALSWLTGARVHLIATAFALLHPLLVVLMYCLGRVAHGPSVARAAAFLAAICPFLYLFAGAILPDLLMSVGISLSLIALVVAQSRRAAVWSLLAGLALGLAYSVKETALVLAAPALLALIIEMRRERKLALVHVAAYLGGLAAVVVVETFALRALTGQWITHIGFIAGSVKEDFGNYAAFQGVDPKSRFHTAFMELKFIGPLWIWLLVVGSLAYAWVEDRCLPILFFAAWMFFYLTWGTSSLSSYSPIPIQARYYAPAFVPATVLTARVLMAMARPIPIARLRAVLFALLIGALMIGEVHRNRLRAGDIYSAWVIRGVEDAYRSASIRRPDLNVVISPDYGWSIDAMFLEGRPRNLLSPHSWDRSRFPEPPFYFVDLGNRWSEATLRQAFGARPIAITAADILYPRPRLERLWLGVRAFFSVVPSPPSGAWYWHTCETLLLLVEAGAEEGSPARTIDTAPLYADSPMGVRRAKDGHVVSWPRSMKRGGAEYFDFKSVYEPPTHEGSQLDGADRRLCVSIDVDALEGDLSLSSQLHGYGLDGSLTSSPPEPLELAETSSIAITHEVAADQPLRAYRVQFVVEPGGEAGHLLIGHPRIIPCDH